MSQLLRKSNKISLLTNNIRLETSLFIVNGGWSDWSSFGDCSKTCGGGEKTRYRTCTNPAPANGGKDCMGSSSDSMSCNEQGCPGQYTVYFGSVEMQKHALGNKLNEVEKRFCAVQSVKQPTEFLQC